MVDLGEVKKRQQQMWATGDFHMIGVSAIAVGERLCDDVGLTAGQRVLDVACGSGNTTLAAARRRASAVGIDYVPALLDRARARAEVEGLPVEFVEGDAESIPFADESFDVVLSTFGAMFAPDQEKVVSELLRVCRPGGVIGMANWVPEGYIDQQFRLNSKFVPPPPGVRPATRWGSGPALREIFGFRVSRIETIDRVIRMRFASPEEQIHTFRTYFGPTSRAFEALDEDRQRELTQALKELIERFNQATDGTVSVRHDYVNVVALKA